MMLEQLDRNSRIGVFDSGLGGLSVLNRAIKLLPEEKFMYFADVDNVPYGDKTREQIVKYVDEAASYMIEKGCKALVIACNSATSAGVSFLREKYDFLPVIGIEPAVKPAIAASVADKRVLVTATPVTIEGEKLKKLIEEYDRDSIVDKLPLPELAMMAEKELFEPEIVVPYLKEKLSGLDTSMYDFIVLGCTHFPFFSDSFKALLPGVRLIDGSDGTARYLKAMLEKYDITSLGDTFEQGKKVVYVKSGREVTDKQEIERIEGLNERWRKLSGLCD